MYKTVTIVKNSVIPRIVAVYLCDYILTLYRDRTIVKTYKLELLPSLYNRRIISERMNPSVQAIHT